MPREITMPQLSIRYRGNAHHVAEARKGIGQGERGVEEVETDKRMEMESSEAGTTWRSSR